MAKVTFANKKIAVIGGGHMGQALCSGILLSRKIRPKNLYLSDSNPRKLSVLKGQGIRTTTKNKEAVSKADIVLIAVRPTAVKEVMYEIQGVACRAIIISCAPGVSVQELRSYSCVGQKLARIMPNMPVMYGGGVVGLFAGHTISKAEKAQLIGIFSALGLVVDLKKDEDIETLTLISACGPAIVSYVMETISAYCRSRGLSLEQSRKIVTQTFIGTLDYLNQSDTSPSDLINAVATKGGVTEAILLGLKKNDLDKTFFRGMQEGLSKIKKLQKTLRK